MSNYRGAPWWVSFSLAGCFGTIQAAQTVESLSQRLEAVERALNAQAQLGVHQQLEQLREEMRQLRGQVEECCHAAKLEEVKSVSVEGAPKPLQEHPEPPSHTVPPDAQVQQETLYKGGYQAVQARRYKEAQAQFKKLLEQSPDGTYAPQALYWLGEVALKDQQFEEATHYFQSVLDRFPQHFKAPDALYKLSLVAQQRGDAAAAGRLIEQLKQRYPQSPAANLVAQRY